MGIGLRRRLVMPTLDKRDAEQVYQRRLPGGGFVAIEVTPVRTLLGQRRFHGEVIVERRIELERRSGHPAPSVASADAASLAAVLHELFPVAQSNTAVAIGVLTHTREHRAR